MYHMVARRGLLTQMRKGALEYCVLALLGGREMYGLELVRALSEVDGMVLSEGTLYPLLSRSRRRAHPGATTASPPRVDAPSPTSLRSGGASETQWRH